MTRAEMTLKVVMSPSESVNAFVEQFFKLLPDADSTEFNRVLEMKSVRKVDQPAYIEYFNTIKPIGKKEICPLKYRTSLVNDRVPN